MLNLEQKTLYMNGLHNFFNNVMIKLSYYDWKLNFCNDCYCWIKNKTIDISLDYKGDIRQIILHEIAHIDTARFCNQKHNPDFWKRLEYLTKRFLNKDLDEYQKLHKNYMTQGKYLSIYNN